MPADAQPLIDQLKTALATAATDVATLKAELAAAQTRGVLTDQQVQDWQAIINQVQTLGKL